MVQRKRRNKQETCYLEDEVVEQLTQTNKSKEASVWLPVLGIFLVGFVIGLLLGLLL